MPASAFWRSQQAVQYDRVVWQHGATLSPAGQRATRFSSSLHIFLVAWSLCGISKILSTASVVCSSMALYERRTSRLSRPVPTEPNKGQISGGDLADDEQGAGGYRRRAMFDVPEMIQVAASTECHSLAVQYIDGSRSPQPGIRTCGSPIAYAMAPVEPHFAGVDTGFVPAITNGFLCTDFERLLFGSTNRGRGGLHWLSQCSLTRCPYGISGWQNWRFGDRLRLMIGSAIAGCSSCPVGR